LDGLAGSGKSALAQTIAELCAERNTLAASFFCSRGSVERKDPRRLFLTIAYQLCLSIPELKGSILRVFADDPSIPDRTIRDQLQQLIVNPLLSADPPSRPPMVVIIDGFDEFGDSHEARAIITLLSEALHHHRFFLRFLITSRREIHIQAKLQDPKVQQTIQSIRLNDYDTHGDIRTFLVLRFKEICQSHFDVMRGVPEPWPSDHDLAKLVKKSGKLFIYASTITKFVESAHEHPERRLQLALSDNPNTTDGPHAELDQLYQQVLSATPFTIFSRMILGAIILLCDPLSVRDLVNLFHLTEGDLRLALRGLHSILLLPDEIHRPVQTVHGSLPDFLMERERSGTYFLDPNICHANIARYCLMLLNQGRLEDELLDPVTKQLDGALHYASRYWAYHLSKASCHDLDPRLLLAMIWFIADSIPFWTYLLGLSGGSRNAISSLQHAQDWLKVRLLLLL
jgi:NACHT domain